MGIAGGFIFSFISLLVVVFVFFISDFFVPTAITALNTTATSLNVTNTPSPKVVFGWVIFVFGVLILAEAFLVGYFGGVEVAIGFFIGAFLILILLGGFMHTIAPGSPIALVASFIVVFIGAFLSQQNS